ncbi:MAG: hypothetical protein U1A27_11740 [Phycisphaerae bacterium]
MTPPRFETDVLRPLQSAAAAIRRAAVVEGACVSAAVLVGLAAAQYALDRLLRLEFSPRLVLLAAIVVALAVQLWRRVVRPLRGQVTLDAVAALLERRSPAARDELLSAVQFAAGPPGDPRFNSPELVAAVVQSAAARFDAAATRRLVSAGRHRARFLLALVALTSAVAGALADPRGASAFLRRNWLLAEVPWPSDTRLTLVGADAGNTLRYPRGDELAIVVRVAGAVPPRGLRLVFRTASGESGERPMAAVGEREFRCLFGPLGESMQLRFRIGRWGVDDQSDEFRIVALERPAVRALAVRVSPPGYARQPAYDWPAGQLAGDVLAGSRVELRATVNKPVESATLIGAAQPIAAARLDERLWQASLTPSRSVSLSFDLVDADGLHDLRPVTCVVRPTADKPPRVRLSLPGAGDIVVANAVLSLLAEYEDNLGLAQAAIRFQVQRTAHAAPASQPTASRPSAAPPPTSRPADGELAPDHFDPGQTRFRFERAWSLAELALQPDDRLNLVAVGRDFNPGDPAAAGNRAAPPTGEGRSAAFSLRIVTAQELLADLARRESAWRQEFEQTLRAQEATRDALRTASERGSAANANVRELARRQRQIASRVKTVRRHFNDILAEMRVNQLVTPQIQQRLGAGVLTPLARLADTTLPDAATQLDRLDPQSPAAWDESLAAQEAILAQMRSILANMLKWEGYNEAVSLMRDLLKLQSDVNRQTQVEIERRLDELFGGPGSQPSESEPLP